MKEILQKLVAENGLQEVIRELAEVCSDRSEECDDDEESESWADVAEDLDDMHVPEGL
jgi:hypothetical protein